ncbi:MAG: WecB/TagA/CpsF family glycosyltransferase, partial [Patescibacteria group bacterium]
IPLTLIDPSERSSVIEAALHSGKLFHLVTVNPEFLVEARNNREFANILRRADLATVDGAGIIFIAKLLGHRARLSQRFPGIALTEQILDHAERHGESIGIIMRHDSITPDDVLRQCLRKRYPKLSFTVFREPISTAELSAAKPDILCVALGSPEQELWIQRHRQEFPGLKLAVGVGGTFDFISGTIKRAPVLLRTIGLEWVWRLLLEPKRIRRIVRAVVIFPLIVFTQR